MVSTKLKKFSNQRIFIIFFLALFAPFTCGAETISTPQGQAKNIQPGSPSSIDSIPLNKPVAQDVVNKWAVDFVKTTFGYDYLNYQSQLKLAQKNVLDPAWTQFMNDIGSRILEDVIKGKLKAIPQVTKPPIILRQGVVSNIYAWELQIPLNVTYTNADNNTSYFRSYFVNVSIIRKKIDATSTGFLIFRITTGEAGGSKSIDEAFALMRKLERIIDAAIGISLRVGGYSFAAANISNKTLLTQLKETDLKTPWGSDITITNPTKDTFDVTISQVPYLVCRTLEENLNTWYSPSIPAFKRISKMTPCNLNGTTNIHYTFKAFAFLVN